MIQARRILVNVVASQLRSLAALLCGFLTSRWALAALGEENYGLLGVVTGLSILVALANTTLSNAVCRYFAYSLGEARSLGGVENCRKWFSLAVCIHLAFAIVLVAFGYPIVVFLIRHFLTIPSEKIELCVSVYRWTCLSSFISMLSVPFKAMYTAKQEIAELTIYSLIQTVVYTIALGYMAFHPGDWFVCVAAWLCFQNSFLNIALAIRAFARFPECRFRKGACAGRLEKLLSFSTWEFLGSVSMACRDQGMAVLVNKFLGPQRNASYSIAWTLAGRAQTFANEVDGAFAPAITTAYGARDRESFHKLMMSCCKYSASLVFLVVVPLSLEIREFLVFWLKTPPVQTAASCVLICLSFAVLKLVNGAHYGILATGRNRDLQLLTFVCYTAAIPVSLIGMKCGAGMMSVGIAYMIVSAFLGCGKLFLARRVVGFSIRVWGACVLLPVLLTSLVGLACALPIRLFVQPSLMRMLTFGGTFVITFVLVGYGVILSGAERRRVRARFVSIIDKLNKP